MILKKLQQLFARTLEILGMRPRKYTYMVTYAYKSNGMLGCGRVFVDRPIKITTQEDVEGLEWVIKKNLNCDEVIMANWKILVNKGACND